MRRGPLILCAVLCGAGLAAQVVVDQAPNQQPPPLPTGKGSIEGSVVNDVTHEPVRKAQVTVNFGGAAPAVTDASGHFVFRNLPPGSYYVFAQHPEFPQPMSPRPPVIVTLAQDEQKRDIVIPLLPGASVSGRVLDEDGRPLAGCFIQALQFQPGPAGNRLNNSRGNSSDDRGQYRLYSLSKGHYYFLAGCQRDIPAPHPFFRRGTETDLPKLIYAPAFYPGSPDLSGAAKVMINAGADLRGLDFQMHVTSAVTVRANLTGDPEALNHNLSVQLIARDASLSNIHRYGGELNPETRTFRARGVPPGSYTLLATAQDKDVAYQGKAPVDIGTRPPEPIELAVIKGAELSGSIEFDGDPPAALENVQVNLAPLEPDFSGQWPNAKVEKSGAFSLPGVLPGHFRLTIVNVPGYVKTLQLGDQQVSPHDFNVAPGASGAMRVVVSNKMATVEGTVSGFRPAAATVWIILMPEDPARSSEGRSWNVTPDGHFEVGGVEPGGYRLYAIYGVEPWPLIQQNPHVFKTLEGRGTRVDLEASGRTTAQVEVIPLEDLNRALQEAE